MNERYDQRIPSKLTSFIWYFVKSHRLKLLSMFAVSLAWAILSSVQPYTLKLIIDAVSNYTQIQGSLASVVMLPSILYILSGIAFNYVYRLYDYLHLLLMPKLQAEIIDKMVEHTERHSHRFFQNALGGGIASQIKDLARSIHEIIEILMDRIFANFMALVVACITLSQVHIIVAAILATWSFFFILSSYYFSKKALVLAENLSTAQSTTIGTIVDSFANIMTVRLFARRNAEQCFIRKKLDHQVACEQALDRYKLNVGKIQGYSMVFMNIIILIFLVYAKQANLVTVGDFVLAMSLTLTIPESVWKLSSEFVPFSQAIGQCQQAMKLVSTPHEITDLSNASSLMIKKGEIEFKNVSFGYSSGKKLINNLSLKIEGGQKIGLVGFSGSGKSTFVNLITRLFDVQHGSICIDGQDIRTVTQASLRQNIGYIPQDPLLFHRSLKENIMYGKPEASEKELLEATQNAHAKEFIDSYELGYETMVGERGVKLSGGQRQRIAIARAFLKNAPILILDEATSSLDTQTEQQIQESIDLLVHNKTVIVVAHRLSTLLNMDRLIVFDSGQIIEDGTHSELLAKDGLYAKLWNAQISGFINDNFGKDELEDIDDLE
ncbi:MAG: ABC-type multidrug transport system, ATPase component [candidate division TM6 bacterium GW2011_GWF2_37_49]|nr:MAG: ABC-type multidrug transport system, ATPase component [candidate division TM6 bacterium GW2011_GWF2_37_49]